MKLLLFEWNAYMQEDMEEVLRELKITYETFSYEFVFDGIYEDEYFERHFEQVLRNGGFDVVLSLNYWPPITRVCHRTGHPYIAWVYDCPIPVNDIAKTLGFPTNHIFLFDRVQYETFRNEGFNTVYHIPLGVNVERLDRLRLTPAEQKKFESDVSFVGNMYSSEYLMLRAELTDYEKGYLESLIETQYRVYGRFYVEELLTDEFLTPIYKRLKGLGLQENSATVFRKWVLRLISREMTRRERMMIIGPLSKRCRFDLYASSREKLLPDVHYKGVVDSFHEMPCVFKASKVNLNISFKQITVGMPLRVLDIMGAGGFLLSNYQEELVENFRPGIDCVIYESVEDAVAKAQYYLQHDEERREIAANGHEAVKRFSYQNQIQKILEFVLQK